MALPNFNAWVTMVEAFDPDLAKVTQKKYGLWRNGQFAHGEDGVRTGVNFNMFPHTTSFFKQQALTDLPEGAKLIDVDADNGHITRLILLPDGEYKIQGRDFIAGDREWEELEPEGNFPANWKNAVLNKRPTPKPYFSNKKEGPHYWQSSYYDFPNDQNILQIMAGIKAKGYDEAGFLALADYLDENGYEEAGEFIRNSFESIKQHSSMRNQGNFSNEDYKTMTKALWDNIYHQIKSSQPTS